MYPHRIRLHGPWEYEIVSAASPDCRGQGSTGASQGRITIPSTLAEASLGSVTGRVLLRRRFGRPRVLDAHERVWLQLAGVRGEARIELNSQSLARVTGLNSLLEFEVTATLAERNELAVTLENCRPDNGITAGAALEIRCQAFLSDVQVQAVPKGGFVRFEITGLVAGQCPHGLEIYAIVDRSPAAYAEVTAGQSFRLLTEPVPSEAGGRQKMLVAVELIDRATVWYRQEFEISA